MVKLNVCYAKQKSLFCKMSLTINFNYIYTQMYPTHSVEDMKDLLKDLHNDMNFLHLRCNSSSCRCEMEHYPVTTVETKEGKYKVSFQIPHDQLCSHCQKSLEPFPEHYRGAGMSFIDHWHPRLLLIAAGHQEELMKKAIFCKEKKYGDLSLDEIKKLTKDTWDYSRYLRRTETNFEWSDREVPSGLLNAMDDNEKELECLEFEVKSRELRNKLTSSVQSDTD